MAFSITGSRSTNPCSVCMQAAAHCGQVAMPQPGKKQGPDRGTASLRRFGRAVGASIWGWPKPSTDGTGQPLFPQGVNGETSGPFWGLGGRVTCRLVDADSRKRATTLHGCFCPIAFPWWFPGVTLLESRSRSRSLCQVLDSAPGSQFPFWGRSVEPLWCL